MSVAVTSIAEALDNSETGVDVADALGFPSAGAYTVRVGSEWMRVTSGQGTTTWTVTRGYNGTTAAAHDNGTAIHYVPDTYPDLARIERLLGTVAAADRLILADLIDKAHAYIVNRVGMFLGPTTATSIDVDGAGAVEIGRLLFVPFGMQSVSSIAVADHTGGSFTTLTATDYILGPRAWEPKQPGQPYTWVRIHDRATTRSYFPSAFENVRITGTLGWEAPPPDIADIADTLVVRMWHARSSGQRDLVGTDEAGNALVSRFLSKRDHDVLRGWAQFTHPMVA